MFINEQMTQPHPSLQQQQQLPISPLYSNQFCQIKHLQTQYNMQTDDIVQICQNNHFRYQ